MPPVDPGAKQLERRILAAAAELARLPQLAALARLAEKRGQGVWLVGGVLRDLGLGLPPLDLDLAAGGDAMGLARALALQCGGVFVLLDKTHASCRVVWPGLHLDITGLRAPDLAGDLAERDFTINALAAPLAGLLAGKTGLVDPTGGLGDLVARRLAPAGPGCLRQDPLRVLRGYRFFSALGMQLPHATRQSLAAAAPGLFRIPKERVRDEWLKLMAGPRAGEAAAAMDQDHVLNHLAPELYFGKGLDQNRYHHLDVFGHSLATLKALDELAGDPAAGGLGPEAVEYMASPGQLALLKTAGLLHDLGKPPCHALKEDGQGSFYGHENTGARLARRRCRALGFSKAQSGLVADLTSLHMRPHQLVAAAAKGELSRRSQRRILQAAENHLPGLFLLALADSMAGRGPARPPDIEQRVVELFRLLCQRRDQELAAALAAPPLVTGHDVMRALGLPPGPLVGRILKATREAQLDQQVKTRAEALDMARGLLPKSGPLP